MVATAALQFWAAPVCPYAQRGWIALKETGAVQCCAGAAAAGALAALDALQAALL